MNLALFDFDGTITTEGTYPGFLRFAVPRKRAIVGGALLSPVILGYKRGLVSEKRIRIILSRCSFQGEDAARIRALGATYARDALPHVLREQAMDRIEWHKAQGDAVIVVSASLDVYLAPWCQSVGVNVICTQLEERGGRLTGRYVAGDCSGAEKLKRIRARYDLGSYARIYAYGDSEEDREMLAIAHEKYYRWQPVAQ